LLKVEIAVIEVFPVEFDPFLRRLRQFQMLTIELG
jgi:hypothetical protein